MPHHDSQHQLCLQIIVLDDDVEKMKGIYNSSTNVTRLANDTSQYVIVPHFRGDPADDALRIGGPTWCDLVRKIRHCNGEDLDELRPRTRRSVPLPDIKPKRKRKKSQSKGKNKSQSKGGKSKRKKVRVSAHSRIHVHTRADTHIHTEDGRTESGSEGMQIF